MWDWDDTIASSSHQEKDHESIVTVIFMYMSCIASLVWWYFIKSRLASIGFDPMPLITSLLPVQVLECPRRCRGRWRFGFGSIFFITIGGLTGIVPANCELVSLIIDIIQRLTFSLAGKAISFYLRRVGFSGGLSFAFVFVVKAFLTAEAAPPT